MVRSEGGCGPTRDEIVRYLRVCDEIQEFDEGSDEGCEVVDTLVDDSDWAVGPREDAVAVLRLNANLDFGAAAVRSSFRLVSRALSCWISEYNR
jgi:hypothetical protein